MFYIDNDTQLTLNDVKAYIKEFKGKELSRLKRLDDYYKNKNEKISNRKMTDEESPNNKISHSFGHYITNTNTTMFIGSPISYKSNEDITTYQDILDKAQEQDVNSNLAKDASKYGYGIQLMYLNEELNISFATLNPLQTVLILSNDIKPKILYAINFWTTKNIINDTDINYIRIYSKQGVRTYKEDVLIEDNVNQFCDIPVFVYKNNDDMIGDYELVIPLIDAYDYLESDSANQSDYFNNCYFYLGIPIPTDKEEFEAVIEKIKRMKKENALVGENLNPQFIAKPIVENEVEKNRLVADIHKLSYTPDMSDNNFANNVSGVAMKYKLLGTLNNVKNKQAKFEQAINERNKVLFEMMKFRMLDTPDYVDVVFTVSLPANDLETAQMINQLSGKLSTETLISQLSFIDDAAYETELLEQENSINTYSIDLSKEDDADEKE